MMSTCWAQALNVGDLLLGAALRVGVDDFLDGRALARFVLQFGKRRLSPRIGEEPVGERDAHRLRATQRAKIDDFGVRPAFSGAMSSLAYGEVFRIKFVEPIIEPISTALMDSAAAIFIVFLPFFDPALFRAVALAEQHGSQFRKVFSERYGSEERWVEEREEKQ